jgi:predicted HAD superfamily hydrolase
MPATDEPVMGWMRDESLRPLAERLAPEAAPPRIVSFDFFDTLISRVCAEPSDLFIETGRQLAARGMLRAEFSPSGFRAARLAADEKARARRAATGAIPELTLGEIYEELGDVVTDPAAARDVEFAVERGLCFANHAMVSLVEHVRSLGCSTAIVSDTYFSTAELMTLLADQGVPASLFDQVLVSCELGKAKWANGTLFHDLLARFDASPGEVLHIGDNVNADVNQARRLGIDALHYYRDTPAVRAAASGERKQPGRLTECAGSLETLRVLGARQAQGDLDPFRDGAFVLGPVLSRFADWCVEKFARAGVRRVLALMREGELLGELLERSAAARGVPLEVVTCYASRMATARAALPTVNPQTAHTLLEGATQLTPHAILEILGLAKEGAEFLDDATRLRPLPTAAAVHKFLDAIFNLPLIRELAEQRHRESHELAFEYLGALVGDDPAVGVLDLGWSGSIQRNIARILKRGGRKVRTVGCYLACTKRAGRLAIEGHEAHAYLESEWNRNAILLEVCTTACIGSTYGYARAADGVVRPLLEPDPNSPEQRVAKGRVREGVLAFQELWLPLYARAEERGWSNELLADIDRASEATLFRWMDYPTKGEADRLSLLYHDENYFGSINSGHACDDDARARLRRDGVHVLFETPGCYWPQGVLAQVYPRLMSALRERWADPIGLGRLGAFGDAWTGCTGLTPDEAASLRTLLGAVYPDQVVFCAPGAPDLAHFFSDVLPASVTNGTGSRTRLVLAGPADPGTAGSDRDTVVPCVRVRGDLDASSTLHAVREAIGCGGSVALVFGGDVSPADVPSLLHGLAPWLGPQGVVLFPCGRYDRHDLQAENPSAPALSAWFESAGTDLGFRLWQGGGRYYHELSNWIAFVHAPDTLLFQRDSTPMAGELPTPAAPSSPNPEAHAPSLADA